MRRELRVQGDAMVPRVLLIRKGAPRQLALSTGGVPGARVARRPRRDPEAEQARLRGRRMFERRLPSRQAQEAPCVQH